MNSFRSLVYPSAEANTTGLVCRDSGFVQVAFAESALATAVPAGMNFGMRVCRPQSTP